MSDSFKYNFISIEGNIGAGKTSLCERIAAEFNAKLILEQFADNPFLQRFYENPRQHAFPVELFFMAERYQQLKVELTEQELFRSFTITDYLFIKSVLFAGINLTEEEHKLYKRLFDIIYPTLPEPDLIVYLFTPVEKLMKNIKSRGRDYEKHITAEYLEKIHQQYMDYFRKFSGSRILIIDMENVDFVKNKLDYINLVNLMNQDYSKGQHYVKLDKRL